MIFRIFRYMLSILKGNMNSCDEGTVCINYEKTMLSVPVIAPTKNFDFAEALESVYPLLEIVFSYLNYKDLKKASQVKKSWEITANKILNKRNKVSWFSVLRRRSQSTIVHCSPNLHNTNARLGIIFFNYRVISLNDHFCMHDDISHKKVKFSDFLNDIIPYKTEYCIISCSGLGSFFPNHSSRRSCVSLFDSCFLPAIPNVNISMFPVDLRNMRNDYIQPNHKIKCLLLFCKEDLGDAIYTIFERLIPEDNWQNVALGGGIIRRSLYYPAKNSFKQSQSKNFCIAFTQNDDNCDFNASSLVINGRSIPAEEFEQNLRNLKRRTLIRKNMLGFIIRCSAKRKSYHETRMFNKVFPGVPVLGLDVEGEIGWNSYNLPDEKKDEGENSPKKPKEGFPISQHQWSSVFMIITWGPLVKK